MDPIYGEDKNALAWFRWKWISIIYRFFTQVVQDFTTIHSMEMETGDPFILW
jgi:hypothetical protein